MQPDLDRIELRIMKEGVMRVTALRTGEVDFANAVPREHVERLTRDTKIQLLKGRETQRLSTHFNQRQRYTIMTHGGEASLPTIATILKTQYAKLGVEVMVEVIDRPIFLRRMYQDRD